MLKKMSEKYSRLNFSKDPIGHLNRRHRSNDQFFRFQVVVLVKKGCCVCLYSPRVPCAFCDFL